MSVPRRPPSVATGFEAKPEKTVAVSFEAKPPETVTAGFEAKPPETVATGFEAKPVKTVRVVLRPNHSQTVDLGFKAQPRNGLARPLDRPATEYPTCAIIPGPLHQVSYSCHDPRHCTPCCTCHLHTTRQANEILQTKQG
jgi:hypothetical protein